MPPPIDFRNTDPQGNIAKILQGKTLQDLLHAGKILNYNPTPPEKAIQLFPGPLFGVWGLVADDKSDWIQVVMEIDNAASVGPTDIDVQANTSIMIVMNGHVTNHNFVLTFDWVSLDKTKAQDTVAFSQNQPAPSPIVVKDKGQGLHHSFTITGKAWTKPVLTDFTYCKLTFPEVHNGGYFTNFQLQRL